MLEDDPTPAQSSQIHRAASLTTSSLRFIRALRKEELPPDAIRDRPLCMYQYSRLFGSSRIPTNSGCVMQSDTTSRHIIVICRSQFYWFDVLDENNDLIMSEKDLAINFQTIIDDALETPITEAAKNAFGVLTTENRRVWANIRDNLTKNEDSVNHDNLQVIDNGLFIVCLDHLDVEDLADLSKNMLCGISQLDMGVQVGTCTNRWYDKIQIIVTKNAKAGINFEHTGVDGHTVLRYVSDIYTDSILRFAKSINSSAPTLWATNSPDPSKRDPASFGDVVTTPRKLEWDMSPDLLLSLRFAETRISDLIEQNEFECLDFNQYGMNYIKRMGFSPDAFVQMSFQAAYYALYGKVECTYEPAMTKFFLHGRTDAIRTVSDESVNFVRKFCEDCSPIDKIDSLRRACEKHVQRTRKCSQGLGQDRHLYALFCIWKRYVEEAAASDPDYSSSDHDHDHGHASDTSSTVGNNVPNLNKKISAKVIPAIFADPGWDKLNNTILSTSNCGNPALRMFGFGPVSPDGFGLGYIIKEDSIVICASSKHRQTRRLLDTLNSYFLEVRNLWKESVPNKPAVGTRARSHERERSLALSGKKTLLVSRRGSPDRSRLGKSLGILSPLPSSVQQVRQTTEEETLNYLLGGYGYFDVGDAEIISRGPSPEPPYSRHLTKLSRKQIGKKLRLSEY